MIPSESSAFTAGVPLISYGGRLPSQSRPQDSPQQGEIQAVGSFDSCLTESRIGKVGYEFNFNRPFFQYQPPRPLQGIDAEPAGVEQRIIELLREVTE